MASRLNHLRLGVQRPILQTASRTRLKPAITFRRAFTHSSRPATNTSRRALALVPLAGGLGLYLYPRETSLLPGLLSSPTLIPCPKPRPVLIESPAEPQRSILRRILALLDDWFLEPLLTARRFVYLFAVFVPVIVSAPLLLVGAPEKRPDGEGWSDIYQGAFRLTWLALGLTFMQLAQWAGSRTDLFPPLLCERLGQLHSSGKPHSFRHTKRVIEHVFGKRFDEIFEHFDHDPIGVGAIAQVSLNVKFCPRVLTQKRRFIGPR
jgi:aarF domain-containing kinase